MMGKEMALMDRILKNLLKEIDHDKPGQMDKLEYNSGLSVFHREACNSISDVLERYEADCDGNKFHMAILKAIRDELIGDVWEKYLKYPKPPGYIDGEQD